MYEIFTDRARKVMQLANMEAARFKHEYIGTEHLLLGLIAEGSGVAANVLKNLGVDVHQVRREVEKIVLPGPDYVPMPKRPLTPRTKKVIEYAQEESRAFKHHYIGTEHLLLGMVRETEGVAAQVLMNVGIRLPVLRDEVLKLLGEPATSTGSVSSRESLLKDKAAMVSTEVAHPDTQHLPVCVREIVAEFDCQIDVIHEEKEIAVGLQAWEKAAELRELEHKLRQLRDEFLSHWPKSTT